jgi:hypothetical protein
MNNDLLRRFARSLISIKHEIEGLTYPIQISKSLNFAEISALCIELARIHEILVNKYFNSLWKWSNAENIRLFLDIYDLFVEIRWQFSDSR